MVLRISICNLCRIYYVEDCVLWTRTVQWAGIVHWSVQLVPEQRHICFLGSISSIGKGQPADCSEHYDWLYRVHEPHEPQHHFGVGLQDLGIICLISIYDSTSLWVFIFIFTIYLSYIKYIATINSTTVMSNTDRKMSNTYWSIFRVNMVDELNGWASNSIPQIQKQIQSHHKNDRVLLFNLLLGQQIQTHIVMNPWRKWFLPILFHVLLHENSTNHHSSDWFRSKRVGIRNRKPIVNTSITICWYAYCNVACLLQ